jgi:polyhydroxyalkanoate synthesis regulator phasin
MTPIEKLLIEIKADTKQLNSALAKSKKGLKDTGKESDKLKNSLKMIGGVIATIGLSQLIGKTIQTVREFEDLEATLRAVTGSAESAATSFKLIRAFTATTTFQIQEVASAFIKLKQAGIIPTSDVLQDFGNLAAGMGRSIETLAQAAFNATTGEMEMLKQFGIIARVEGDKLKVTFDGTTKMIERNGEAITGFLREVGRESFSDALEQRAKTLSGAISNMKDASSEFMVAIGEGGLKDVLADLSLEMKDLLMNNRELAHNLGKVLGGAVNILANTLKFLLQNIELVTAAFAFMVGSSIAGALNTMMPTLISLFTKLNKVLKGTATMAIVLQGATGIGIAKVAAGLTLAGASLAVMNKMLDDADDKGGDATQTMAELDSELQLGMMKNEKVIDKVSKSIQNLSEAIKSIPKGKFSIFDQLQEMNLSSAQLMNQMRGQERDMFFGQEFGKSSPNQTIGVELSKLMKDGLFGADQGLEAFGFDMGDFVDTVSGQTTLLAKAIDTNILRALRKSGFSNEEAGEVIQKGLQKFFDDPDVAPEAKSVAGYYKHILEQARGQSEAHVENFYSELFGVDQDFFEKNMGPLLDIPNLENVFGAVDNLGRENLLGTTLKELEDVLGDDGAFQGFIAMAKSLDHFIGMTDDAIRTALTEYIRLGNESMEVDPFANLKGLDKLMFDAFDDAINGSEALLQSLEDMTEVELEAKLLAISDMLVHFGISADKAKEILDELVSESKDASTTLGEELGTAIQSLSLAFTNDFVNALAEGEDALDSFESFAANIVKQIIAIFLQLAIVNKILNTIFPGLGAPQMDMFGPDAFQVTRPTASGGRISGPRMVGERGPELFIPDATGVIKSNADSKGMMGGQPINIYQSVNFATGVVPTVRAEVIKMMPQIAEVTKGAVAESSSRGGSYRRSLLGG